MPISLIVASSEPHFREFVREHLAHTPGAKLVAEHDEVGLNVYVRILHDMERNPHAAVLLDIGADPEQGLRALEHMKNAMPGLYVIVSEYQASSEFLIRGLRGGANDYIQQPLKRPEFRDAMTRLEQHVARAQQHGKPLGKLYTFLGAKGGVGTTTDAVNFAAVCARQQKSTILLDLDLDSGDAASFLGLNPQYSIYDVVENLDRLDHSMLDGIASRDAIGFSVLSPPDDLEKARMIRGDHIKEIAAFLVEKYDAVVVDGSRGLDETLLGCLELSESVFLVLTQEFLAVRNAQQYLAALGKLGFSAEQLKIVVNRYGKGQNSAVSMEQIQQTLGSKIFYAIPNRYQDSMQAVHHSRPAVTYAGDLQNAYLGMAKKILSNGASSSASSASAAAPPPERKKFLGII